MVDSTENRAQNLAKKLSLATSCSFDFALGVIFTCLQNGMSIEKVEEYYKDTIESDKISTKEKHMKTVVCLKSGEVFELMDVESRLLDTLSETGERLRAFTNKETKESLLCYNIDIRYIWKYEVED